MLRGEGLNLFLQGDVHLADYVQIFQHSEDFTVGLIDSRPFVLYLTSTALLLFLAVVAVETRASKT